MSDHIVVLPSIWQPYTNACLRTVLDCPDYDADVMTIDNTVHNRGVAASWNVGLRMMMADRDCRWTIIVSAAVRFGAPEGSLIRQLRERDLEWGAISHLGWHLAAVGRPMVERIGYFDENFWPGYMEDTDYTYRQWLAGKDDPNINVPTLNVLDGLASIGHAVQLAGVQIDGAPMEAYWRRKWGAPSADRWQLDDQRPFRSHDLAYWPETT